MPKFFNQLHTPLVTVYYGTHIPVPDIVSSEMETEAIDHKEYDKRCNLNSYRVIRGTAYVIDERDDLEGLMLLLTEEVTKNVLVDRIIERSTIFRLKDSDIRIEKDGVKLCQGEHEITIMTREAFLEVIEAASILDAMYIKHDASTESTSHFNRPA